MMNNLKKRLRSDLWIVLLDIIAVNGAYLLALLIRFYVHFKFTSGVGDFREYYLEFTPFYTVLCLVVFYICGLYNGLWQYAGLDDMNRIILANVITAAIHVFGTRWFVHSMPTSYYLIGAFLQFLMIAAIRFSYRFLLARKQRSDKQKSWAIPALVVASGDNGKAFVRYLEEHSPFEVAVIADGQGGRTMDGIPIVDYSSIPAQIQYHGIYAMFIADDSLSPEKREEIKQAAGGIVVRDYVEYLSELPGCMPLSPLLEIIDGPVSVSVDGIEREYSSYQECVAALSDRYEITRITGARIETRSTK